MFAEGTLIENMLWQNCSDSVIVQVSFHLTSLLSTVVTSLSNIEQYCSWCNRDHSMSLSIMRVLGTPNEIRDLSLVLLVWTMCCRVSGK